VIGVGLVAVIIAVIFVMCVPVVVVTVLVVMIVMAIRIRRVNVTLHVSRGTVVIVTRVLVVAALEEVLALEDHNTRRDACHEQYAAENQGRLQLL